MIFPTCIPTKSSRIKAVSVIEYRKLSLGSDTIKNMSEEIQVGDYVNMLVAPTEDVQYGLVSRIIDEEVVMMKIVDVHSMVQTEDLLFEQKEIEMFNSFNRNIMMC